MSNPKSLKTFKKGFDERRNLKGRGKSFDTIFEEAIREIVKNKKLPIKDPEKEMMIKGIIEALKGNYQFWRALSEWRYGKPQEKVDFTSGGEKITGINYIIPKEKNDTDKGENNTTEADLEATSSE